MWMLLVSLEGQEAVAVMLVEMVEPQELRDKEMLAEILPMEALGVAEAAVVKEPLEETEKLLEMEERAPILMLLGQPQLVQALTVVTTLVVEAVEYTILLLEIPQAVLEAAVKANLEMAEMELQELQTPEVVEAVEEVGLTLVMVELAVQEL